MKNGRKKGGSAHSAVDRFEFASDIPIVDTEDLPDAVRPYPPDFFGLMPSLLAPAVVTGTRGGMTDFLVHAMLQRR